MGAKRAAENASSISANAFDDFQSTGLIGYECCGRNMAHLETATDRYILAPWQFNRDKCDLHFRLLDELVGDVDLQNGNETGLPAR